MACPGTARAIPGQAAIRRPRSNSARRPWASRDPAAVLQHRAAPPGQPIASPTDSTPPIPLPPSSLPVRRGLALARPTRQAHDERPPPSSAHHHRRAPLAALRIPRPPRALGMWPRRAGREGNPDPRAPRRDIRSDALGDAAVDQRADRQPHQIDRAAGAGLQLADRARAHRRAAERAGQRVAAPRVAQLVERRPVRALHQLAGRAERRQVQAKLPERRDRRVLHARRRQPRGRQHLALLGAHALQPRTVPSLQPPPPFTTSGSRALPRSRRIRPLLSNFMFERSCKNR